MSEASSNRRPSVQVTLWQDSAPADTKSTVARWGRLTALLLRVERRIEEERHQAA